MPVAFWTLFSKFLMLLLKIGDDYFITFSGKVKNTFTMVKNSKKYFNFNQLRCSNIVLRLKYKVVLCEHLSILKEEKP